MKLLSSVKSKIKQCISFFDEIYRSFIRWLDSDNGRRLRYSYYKKRLHFLGENVIIETGVFIIGAEYISIGDNSYIDKNCILVGCSPDFDISYRYLKIKKNSLYTGKKGEIFIGKECHLSQNTMLYGYGGIFIDDNSVLSAGSKVYSLTSMAYNPYDKSEIVSIMPYQGKSPTMIGPVVLGKNVWCGIDSVVSPGVYLGDNSFIKSQSIVNSSFASNTYAGGSPAIFIRNRFDIRN